MELFTEVVVTAPSVDSIKNRLGRHNNTEEFLYNYKARKPTVRKKLSKPK